MGVLRETFAGFRFKNARNRENFPIFKRFYRKKLKNQKSALIPGK
jgi:hypothetical protein